MKLGGSVITHKKRSPPQINDENLSRIAQELSARQERMIIVLGGGAHGHQAAHKFGFGNPSTPRNQLLSGVPHIRHNMSLLSLAVETSLNEHNLSSTVITPFSFVRLNNGQIESFSLEGISQTLEASIVPILHGDVCYDLTKGASILSGDTIVAYLAKNLQASHIYIGTDVDGIFSANPQDDSDAALISEITEANAYEVFRKVGPSSSTDVTGGMQKKLEELLSLTKSHQSEVVIFNLCVPGRLQTLLLGKPAICTRLLST